MRHARITIYLLLLLMGLGLWAYAQEEPPAATPIVQVITINGTINPGSAEFIVAAIEKAERDGAAALAIELDTPGGLVDSTRDIVQKMLAANVPVIVYVTPKGAHAGSAGVMVTLAGHIAAMAPSTSIGAASPVSMTGEMDETMKAKAFNDITAFVEGIAEARGRNVEWAKKAVTEADAVTATRAAKLNVVDFVAEDLDDVLTQADGRQVKLGNGTTVTLALKGARQAPQQMSLKHKIIFYLADPNLVYFFMIIGMLGLYAEFSHPGLIFPGVIGGICILLFLVSTQILPINTVGLILIAGGLVLFILEFKFTSYGLLTLGGIALMVLGSLFLFDAPEKVYQTPSFKLQVSWGLILPSVLALGGFTLFVAYKVLRAQISKGLTGQEGIVGELGVATTDVHHEGKVRVQGIYWDASSAQPIASGSRIRVTATDGLKLKVEKIEEA
ncbi:MAG TPA: nodulation protein NfeD [bacterium]|nr:nodulation protein NfeD [bacterium]